MFASIFILMALPWLDSSKVRGHTGWKPKTSLWAGLVKSIQDYKKIL